MASSKQVVGNPTPRVEGELKVSGEAKYAVDVTLRECSGESCCAARSLREGSNASTRVRRWRLPGVHAVITGADCTGLEDRPAALRHADPRRRRS